MARTQILLTPGNHGCVETRARELTREVRVTVATVWQRGQFSCACARHRVIRCFRCPRDFQLVSASPNDTLCYLRCITHPHHATQTNPRPIRRSIQSLSWHTPTRCNRSLIQTWCAPSLYKFLHSFCARLRKPGAFLALRQLQAERPSYRVGVEKWWCEVISRTAVGAGADPQAVERHLSVIVPSLMKRFSSREGYSLFDDTLVTRASSLHPRGLSVRTKELINFIVRTLRKMGMRTGLITNSDARIGAPLRRVIRLCAQSSCSGCSPGPWGIRIPFPHGHK
jgi:hypothetical protein